MNTRARIVTVSQGRRYPTMAQNREHVLGLLSLALRQKPDLVCLPETFTIPAAAYASAAEIAEPIDGPTVDAASALARRHGSYVVCPLLLDRGERVTNSAVVLGRDGAVVGVYDKVRPVSSSADYTVFESGVFPGDAPVALDLDFGVVGLQICFDAGFPENWAALEAAGARLVLWPSAYRGGFALPAYAYLHRFWVVSAVSGDGARIIDPLGRVVAETDAGCQLAVRDINLDFAVCHYDFNFSVPDLLLERYGERVRIETDMPSARFLVEPVDPSLRTDQLAAEVGFETVDRYFERHRVAQAALRAGATPTPQDAAHGERPMYGKWWAPQ